MPWTQKIIFWLFSALLFLVPLIFLPNTSELFEFNKMILTYLITTLIALLWLIRMLQEQRLIFRRTLLDLPLLIFLLSQFISLIFSIDHRTSWLGYYSRFNGGFVSLLCYSLLYWAAVSHLTTENVRKILRFSLTSATLVSLYGITEHFGIDKNLWVQDVQNRVFSTLGQPNWLAAYISALIFIPISWLLSKPELDQKKPHSVSKSILNLRVLYLALTVILFITLLFTKSRSGIIAFFLSWIVFWILQIKFFGLKLLKNYLALGTWCLVLILTVSIRTPIRDLIFTNLNIRAENSVQSTDSGSTVLESGGTESGDIRKIVWQGALDIWRSSTKNIWFGTGPETFAMAYYQHRPLAHNQTSEWELLYNKAHNEYLNYLSTTGLFGLISYLFLLGSMFFTLLKSQVSNPKSQINSALFTGWLTILVTNFWGFSVVIVQIIMFLLPAFSLILDSPPTPQKPLSKTKNLHPFLLLLFCSPAFMVLIFILRYWVADVRFASGQKFLRSFSLTQDPQYLASAYSSYISAYQLNKKDPPLLSELSLSTSYMSLLLSDSQPETSAQLASTAIALGQKAILTSPYHPNYYKTLSRVLVILGSIDENYLASADEILSQAELISPTDPRIPYNRGLIAQYRKDYSTAQTYFQKALTLRPQYAEPAVALESIATLSATPSSK